MNPLALYVHDKSDVVAYACGACRYVKHNHADALACCAPRLCACGSTIAEAYYTACSECRARDERARLRERLLAATRVDEGAAEYLVCECHDQFEPNAEELFDWHECRDAELPLYAWACAKITLGLDAADVVRREIESGEFHEDAGEDLGAVDFADLQKAMDVFCEEANVTSYQADYTRIVLLDVARAERLQGRDDLGGEGG